jgi:hypothetical protein
MTMCLAHVAETDERLVAGLCVVCQTAEIERLRAALDLIWHIAPLPTQSDTQRLERIHQIAREVLFPHVGEQKVPNEAR